MTVSIESVQDLRGFGGEASPLPALAGGLPFIIAGNRAIQQYAIQCYIMAVASKATAAKRSICVEVEAAKATASNLQDSAELKSI